MTELASPYSCGPVAIQQPAGPEYLSTETYRHFAQGLFMRRWLTGQPSAVREMGTLRQKAMVELPPEQVTLG
jgi:hypothetical protein